MALDRPVAYFLDPPMYWGVIIFVEHRRDEPVVADQRKFVRVRATSQVFRLSGSDNLKQACQHFDQVGPAKMLVSVQATSETLSRIVALIDGAKF